MSLDLEQIDLSAVEALATIKAEQDQLESRLKAMAARRDQVSSEVFQRVHGDYRKRLDELAAEAAPLKIRAGDTYRALKAELGGFEAAFEAARLDREEIEFRCSLGEFDDAELKSRLMAVDERIGAHGKARELALSLRERFLSVVSSESELEGFDDDTARMNALGPANPSTRQIQPVSATIVAAPIKGPPEPPEASHTIISAPMTAPPPAPAPTPAPVVAMPAPVSVIPPPAALPQQRTASSRSSRNPDATVVFRQGRLEPRNGEAGSVVQTLGLKPVTIGSDGGCDLHLTAAGVGKRHAEISMTRAGFSVRDHAGAGSTKVNGEVVQERVLSDGDTLSLGPAQFNFRLL
jgi:hypothetical protein